MHPVSKPAAQRRITTYPPPRRRAAVPSAMQAEHDKLMVRKADLSLAAGALEITANPRKAISELHETIRDVFNPAGGDWKASLRAEIDRIDQQLDDIALRIDASQLDAQLDGAA